MQEFGLIYGYYLSGQQRGQAISWETIPDAVASNEKIWLHFDYSHPTTIKWIEENESLDPLVARALLNEETRPRATAIQQGVLCSLRGVNLNPESDPKDMVAIRIWLDERCVISTRKRPILSVRDVVDAIASGVGPQSPGELVSMLAERLISRMQETIQLTEDRVDQLEETILEVESYALRSEIADLRRHAISLRRYLAPQREAMMQLQSDRLTVFSNDDRLHFRETTDHLIRYIEDLDAVRDRAAVTQEELVNRLSEQLNNRMYVLSIVAAIFLPLGFFTGLLGINVGGIPGADNHYAFMLFIGFLVIIVGLQVWLFKRKGWF